MNELKRIIAVTPTYPYANREKYFRRCVKTFRKVKNFLWIIVEDGSSVDPKIKELLDVSKIEYLYDCYGPTRDWGTSQRNYAFSLIRKEKLQGIVYVPDDDNFYNQRLFKEIRKTKKVSVFPVGHLGPNLIERPIIKNKRIVDWDAYWKERKFPLDWAGFAFSSELLINHTGEFLKGFNWTQAVKDNIVDPNMSESKRHAFLRAHKDGETEFLQNINISVDELEPLCNNCAKCYAWHNQPLDESPRYTFYKKKIYRLIRTIAKKMKNYVYGLAGIRKGGNKKDEKK